MRSTNRAFTLIELLVVIAIIGILAAFAVPRFMVAVERSKAGEAFNYLSAIRSAQERYQVRQGTYAIGIAGLAVLDIEMSTPKYFSVGTPEEGDTGSEEDSWTMTLTRSGSAANYGNYTVVFTQDGFDEDNSTIPDTINPMQR